MREWAARARNSSDVLWRMDLAPLSAQWSTNKAWLCAASPDAQSHGVAKQPNSKAYSIIFRAAQLLAGLRPMYPTEYATEWHNADAGGRVASSANGTVAYLANWKCANNQLNAYFTSIQSTELSVTNHMAATRRDEFDTNLTF